jgi:putative lipoprotein (rSAM/lipoprotein system)
VRGTVVDKATGKPIKGIWVGYDTGPKAELMYGVVPTPYQPKASVTTDENGAFNLTDHFNLEEYQLDENNNPIIPVYVEDIDGEQNGSYQADTLQVNFGNAIRSGKPKDWYKGEFTVTENVKLDEIKNQ